MECRRLILKVGKMSFLTGYQNLSSLNSLPLDSPNVIVLLLPESKVEAAMQYAKAALKQEWLKLGSLVFNNLQNEKHWMPYLNQDHKTWEGWLNSQWQTYLECSADWR